MKSLLKRYIRKFHHAFAGLFSGLCHDRSIRLQACIGLIVIGVCAFLALSWQEWVIVLSMILLVLAAEFINSSLEEICDVLFPNYDQRAKTIKDYAAAAVLIISLLAAVVGIYVIGGKLF